MYSFEGDFRRKPQQNLAGASAQRKTDRDALILQTQQQRQKREVNYIIKKYFLINNHAEILSCNETFHYIPVNIL